MRGLFVFLSASLLALTLRGATPETGKIALRKLVKLPSITFDATWSFNPEHGFTVGSSQEDALAKIADLHKQLQHDPGDAEAFLRISQLYASINDGMSARRAATRAADYFRKRVDMHPGDALLLAELGQSLQGAGKMQEAESYLRTAVQTAPKEWKCQLALGRFLDTRARREMDGYADSGSALSKITLTRRDLAEAGECFDQAVNLAPKEGEVYFRRGMHRSLKATLLSQIRISEGESMDEALQSNNQFSDAALADLQRASRLQSNDHALIGSVILFEIYNTSAHEGRIDWSSFAWNDLPEKSQRSIRESLTRLENLAQDPDPRQAAGALEVLGILQGPVLHEPRNCINNLRRTLALDSSRDQAWEVLAATLAQSGRYDELLSSCADRVKQKESARGHLLLAKAFEKRRQWEDSEGEVLESLRMAPNNFTANLAEAALVLRRSQDDDGLTEANNWLSRCERLLGDTPPAQRSNQLIVELTLTRSIYFALSDQVDAARQWAKAVIDQDKNNGLAHEILAAMDY